MPVLTLQLGQGQTTTDQKAQLVRRLATDAAQITGIPAEKFITFIDEYPQEAIGLGLTTLAEVHATR
jgi:4-oxalocrotonate tautomerase